MRSKHFPRLLIGFSLFVLFGILIYSVRSSSKEDNGAWAQGRKAITAFVETYNDSLEKYISEEFLDSFQFYRKNPFEKIAVFGDSGNILFYFRPFSDSLKDRSGIYYHDRNPFFKILELEGNIIEQERHRRYFSDIRIGGHSGAFGPHRFFYPVPITLFPQSNLFAEGLQHYLTFPDKTWRFNYPGIFILIRDTIGDFSSLKQITTDYAAFCVMSDISKLFKRSQLFRNAQAEEQLKNLVDEILAESSKPDQKLWQQQASLQALRDSAKKLAVSDGFIDSLYAFQDSKRGIGYVVLPYKNNTCFQIQACALIALTTTLLFVLKNNKLYPLNKKTQLSLLTGVFFYCWAQRPEKIQVLYMSPLILIMCLCLSFMYFLGQKNTFFARRK